MKYIKRKIRAIRNRVRKFRRSPAYDTFLGTFIALVAYTALVLVAVHV